MTVLFTDLAGSTAWRVHVGDRAADARMTELERVSRDIVRHDGGAMLSRAWAMA